MSTAPHNSSSIHSAPTPELVRAEVDRALASTSFRTSELLSRFLQFVVERTLSGEGDRLKEYRIGVEVFDRPSSYDPRLDPIVRLEARRLRLKLQHYYEGEGRQDPVRIEVPKGGYSATFRFNHTEELAEQPQTPDATRSISPPSLRLSRRHKWLVSAGVLCVAAVATFFFLRTGQRERPTGERFPSLAVLPFENLSANADDEYFSDGLTDELTSALGTVPGLRVAARNSVFRFKGNRDDVRSIGEQLGVASLLRGSIRKNGNDMRVTAELIRVADGNRIWSATYDRGTKDTLAVESEISQSIAAAMSRKFSAARVNNVPPHVADPEAHELYLRGRYWWNRRMTPDVLKAIHYFNQALEHDPLYAPAYLGLADAYAVMGADDEAPPQEVFPKARAAVERALQLDDSLSEAHATLAHITCYYDWNLPKAEQEFKKALELNPNYATAHQWYGLLFLYSRRFDQALIEFTKAQALDPLALIITAGMDRIYFYSGNYDAAQQLATKMLSYDPDFPLAHDSLGQVYAWTGRYKEAVEEFEKYQALSGHDTDPLVNLAETYALAGQRTKALAIVQELQDPKAGYTSAYNFATIYACLGEKNATYDWLDKALREHSTGLILLDIDPAFREFRSEAHFRYLLSKSGHASLQ